MIETFIQKLEDICKNSPELFGRISLEHWEAKPGPDKWSKKQILGHLIDSATNNHQRFVRAQFESAPNIRYDQILWNRYGFYQDIPISQLINFWTAYNLQLIEIIRRIPENSLDNIVRVGENEYTLNFIISDYVIHLEHHLNQILDR